MSKKKVTSRDVAREAGVSQSTVSFVLNNSPRVTLKPETRDAVLKAAKKLNYQPNSLARGMKMARANSVGLLSLWDVQSFVFPPVMQGLRSVCTENNYSITLCTGKENLQGMPDYVEYYLQNRIDGLVFISYIGIDLSKQIQELSMKKIPFVSIIGGKEIPEVHTVTTNLFHGAYKSTTHLIEQGYEKIMYIKPSGFLNWGEKGRIEGYRKALSDHGLSWLDIRAVHGSTQKQKVEEMIEIIDQTKPDAIVTCHSYWGYIVITAASKLGISLPDQLGVIACDHDTFAPFLAIPLSTVDDPLYEMGVKAGEILFKLFDNPSAPCEKIEVESSLIIRESTSRK